jgi:streptogramin lyase
LGTQHEVETVEVGRSPWGLAFGFRSVWAPTANQLVRIDARTGAVTDRIAFPRSLLKGPTVAGDPLIFNWAAVGSGGVWVTIARERLSVLHIDPSSNEIVAAVDVGRAPDAPTPLAVGAGGVWVSNPASSDLVRIDPHTDEIVQTIGLRGFAPVRASGIAVADGSVWVMDHNSAQLLRIDPSTGKMSDRVGLDTSGRLSSSGDTIWAASAGESIIQAVDARTAKALPPVETCAGVNNVVASSGTVWVSTNAALTCVIDMETDEQQMIELPAAGGILAVDDASAWVSLPADGSVAHVSLGD